MLRQDEEVTQQVKWTDHTMPSIAAARMVGELGIHTQYSWGIATLVMLATGVQAQDSSMLQDNSGPPWEGVKDLPHGCSTGTQETQPQEHDQAPRQEYTTLLEGATFDSPATLGTIHRL